MRYVASLMLCAFLASPAWADPAAPSTTPVSAPAPLLQRLDAEVRKAYCDVSEGIVRVHLPAGAMNPAADVIRKWEFRLSPDVRDRLRAEHASADRDAVTTRPADRAADRPIGPATAPAERGADVMTVGLVLDDAGRLFVPAYLDPAWFPDGLRVTTKDGAELAATVVAGDRATGVTVLRCAGPAGRPVRLAAGRPVEGALLIALCGSETKLLVWTGASAESAVVVTGDGAVGVLRRGRFLGGAGYASLVEQLSGGGPARRASIGMMVGELPATDQGELARVDVVDRPGLRVERVLPGTPAAAAGVRPGDLLLAIDGQTVPDTTSLAALLTALRGDVELTLARDGRRVAVTATLAPPAPAPGPTTGPAPRDRAKTPAVD